MKRLISSVVIVAAMLLSSFAWSSGAQAETDCVTNPSADGCPCAVAPDSSACKDLGKTGASSANEFNRIIQNIINFLLFGIGIASVIMLIVGSIKFTSSRGDSSATAKARNTIAYSVAGLVVAIVAFAIVQFVINAL